jgi:hypothetical protein
MSERAAVQLPRWWLHTYPVTVVGYSCKHTVYEGLQARGCRPTKRTGIMTKLAKPQGLTWLRNHFTRRKLFEMPFAAAQGIVRELSNAPFSAANGGVCTKLLGCKCLVNLPATCWPAPYFHRPRFARAHRRASAVCGDLARSEQSLRNSTRLADLLSAAMRLLSEAWLRCWGPQQCEHNPCHSAGLVQGKVKQRREHLHGRSMC